MPPYLRKIQNSVKIPLHNSLQPILTLQLLLLWRNVAPLFIPPTVFQQAQWARTHTQGNPL